MFYVLDSNGFDLGVILRILYEAMISVASSISDIWNFLQTSKKFGFDLFGTFIGLEFVPLDLIGGSIIVLLTLWLISLVPFL